MNAIMKSIIAASIVASFSLNAIADDIPAKSPEAMHHGDAKPDPGAARRETQGDARRIPEEIPGRTGSDA